jgi:hypothetical protein
MKTHILHNFMIFMLANIAFTDLYLTLHRQVLQTLLLQILILPCADRYYRHCFYRFWSYLVQTGITDIAFTDFDPTLCRQVLQTLLLQILILPCEDRYYKHSSYRFYTCFPTDQTWKTLFLYMWNTPTTNHCTAFNMCIF